MSEIENPENRKTYQHLPGEENPQFLEDAKEVFKLLRQKYPKGTVTDLDNILSALCISLHLLIINFVNKDERRGFVQLIYKVLSENIEREEKCSKS